MADKVWYVVVDSKAKGPFTIDEIKDRIGKGETKKEDFVFRPGLPNWIAVKDCQELNAQEAKVENLEPKVEFVVEPAVEAKPEPKIEESLNDAVTNPSISVQRVEPTSPQFELKPELGIQEEKVIESSEAPAPAAATAAAAPALSSAWGKKAKFMVAGGAAVLAMVVVASYVRFVRSEKNVTIEQPQAQTAVQAPVQTAPPPVAAQAAVQNPTVQNPAVAQGAVPAKPKTLAIIPLRLATSNPQLSFEGAFDPGQEIQVEVRAKGGQILQYASYFAQRTVTATAGQVPSLDLSEMKLPAGAYTVRATTQGLNAESKILIGQQDKAFQKKITAFKKVVQAQQKKEKALLAKQSGELKRIVASLDQIYRKNKKDKKGWAQAYKGWRKKVTQVHSQLPKVGERDRNKFAYPEAIQKAQGVYRQVADLSKSYDAQLKSGRAVASSDELKQQLAQSLRSLDKEIKGIR